MKKSSKIHLVLITAALASCNRVIIPENTAAGYTPDSTLTQTPDPIDSSYSCCREFNSNNWNQYYNPYNPYSPSFGIFYTGRPYGYLITPGYRYKGGIWRNQQQQYVFRGGFGKTAGASVAS